jgi:colanic acid/amylovoran biosynthesis glycosyltransferase
MMVQLAVERKGAKADLVAYMMNTYPVTSATFIRREIEALEQAGVRVERFAARRWSESLVDPLDRAEQDRTTYLFTGNVIGLFGQTFRAIVRRPVGLWRACIVAVRLAWAARGGLIRHFGYLMQACDLSAQCAERGVSHIHAHFSTNAAAVAMLSRIMGGPPYSFTVHGPDELVNPAAGGLRMKVQHASRVVAITHYCRGRILDEIDKHDVSKIVIVPCGLHLDQFPPAYCPPTAPSQIVCVGRLCPQKGQVHIPGAVARLKLRFPDLRVKLIGDGESRAEIEDAIRAHEVSDRVELAGWATNEQVRADILASRALLLPSYAEGLPVVIMEAFALHRPVISTTIAGIPELVDEACGWLVAPGDEAALAQALEQAMAASPHVLRRMGEEGRRRVERAHNLRIVASSLKSNVFELSYVPPAESGPGPTLSS